MSPVPSIPEDLWGQIPPAAQAAVRATFQLYEARIAALEQRLAQLQERLGQDSTNSSRPPSTDPPTVKRSPPQPPSGRRSGGQPGHPRQQRLLLPPDQVVPLRPAACRGCGHALHGDDPLPLRHQVLDLPPIRPVVTEYQRHRLTCQHCGRSTCAALPAGVPSGQQGPRLQAVVALLTGAYRLSKRTAEALCTDVLGVPLSAGQVCAVEREAAAATEPVLAPLREHVRTCNAHTDETGWREGGQKAWLWTVVTAAVTVFHIASSRAARVAKELLGPGYAHILTSDRWKSYRWVPLGQWQACWAHLRRDFQAMIDRHNTGSKIGEDLLLLSDAVFTAWHRVRDGTLQRKTFVYRVEQWYRPDVWATLEAGCRCRCAQTAAVCRALLAIEPALWTFVRAEGVEPTNNAAERALRHAVQWRKTSYGTASAAGSRFVANLLSVVATCRQQGRNVLEFLTACCQARLHGTTPPSLLPQANS